jgi:transposase InsO family protein
MQSDYPMTVLCEAFAVSRSGYYAWRERLPSARKRGDQLLDQLIEQIHQQSRATYGSPRVQVVLRHQGQRVSRKRVARLMRQAQLCGRQRRHFRPRTTDSRHTHPIAPNRLADAPPPTASNQVWVGDITYVATAEGWLYVAGIMDRYSRRLIGWAFADHLESSLPLSALQMALTHRQPPAQLVHHTDRGSQYASAAYRVALEAAGLLASMSRPGCCYDNAAMESFWSTLKQELVHRTSFATRAQAQLALFEWIETFYNRRRLHSALGYQSPVDFETQLN